MWFIESRRLRLVEFQLSDAAFIVQLLNEPTFIENIADKGVRTIDDAHAYLSDGPIASYKKNGFGLWKILLRGTDEVIGMCGLIQREILDDVDVGYALSPAYVGQGYAQEAVSAVLKYAKQYLLLKRMVAIVNPKNRRSITLLNKLGFSYERMLILSETDEVMLFGTPI